MKLGEIEELLAYKFMDEQWLMQALTHPSVDQKKRTNLNYERLEYLGDAVLELVVSRELMTRFPQANEGELTQMRAAIVSRQNLAILSEKFGWGKYIRLSPQLESTGGREKLSILANTFESIIGAVMMDSHYKAASRVSLKLLSQSLDEVFSVAKEINCKGSLIEILQSINNEHPTYEVRALVEGGLGPFEAKVYWSGLCLGTGQGANKRKAQISAASDALKLRLWIKM